MYFVKDNLKLNIWIKEPFVGKETWRIATEKMGGSTPEVTLQWATHNIPKNCEVLLFDDEGNLLKDLKEEPNSFKFNYTQKTFFNLSAFISTYEIRITASSQNLHDMLRIGEQKPEGLFLKDKYPQTTDRPYILIYSLRNDERLKCHLVERLDKMSPWQNIIVKTNQLKDEIRLEWTLENLPNVR
jgi:hypothetical protein